MPLYTGKEGVDSHESARFTRTFSFIVPLYTYPLHKAKPQRDNDNPRGRIVRFIHSHLLLLHPLQFRPVYLVELLDGLVHLLKELGHPFSRDRGDARKLYVAGVCVCVCMRSRGRSVYGNVLPCHMRVCVRACACACNLHTSLRNGRDNGLLARVMASDMLLLGLEGHEINRARAIGYVGMGGEEKGRQKEGMGETG